MKDIAKLSFSLLAIFIALLVMSASRYDALDQYDLVWWTVDCGGGTSQSGGMEYSLVSTIGQPDAWETLSGGDFDMGGGFFSDATPAFRLYLPLIVSNH
jgi:hypothetical protein